MGRLLASFGPGGVRAPLAPGRHHYSPPLQRQRKGPRTRPPTPQILTVQQQLPGNVISCEIDDAKFVAHLASLASTAHSTHRWRENIKQGSHNFCQRRVWRSGARTPPKKAHASGVGAHPPPRPVVNPNTPTFHTEILSTKDPPHDPAINPTTCIAFRSKNTFEKGACIWRGCPPRPRPVVNPHTPSFLTE